MSLTSKLSEGIAARQVARPVPLRETVYEAILELIITGELKPGQHLVEKELAEVKQSASEYDQARSDLSGYQIVLDHADTPELQQECLKMVRWGAGMRYAYTQALYDYYVKPDLEATGDVEDAAELDKDSAGIGSA